MLTNRKLMVLLMALTMAFLFALTFNTASLLAQPAETTTLDPTTIPKYTNQLVIPPVYEPKVMTDVYGNVSHNYTVDVTEFDEQILPPGYPKTEVWGYGGIVKDPATGKLVHFRNAPGATFEAVRDIPVNVRWQNKLFEPGTMDPLDHMFAVDPTLHWANTNNMPMEPPKPWPPFPPGFPEAQSPVPLVTHLHGGEVRSDSDGHPEAWYTPDGKQGMAYNTTAPAKDNEAVFHYPNGQLPTTLWYHDHALGITRINVMSGLAGFYLLREKGDPIAQYLPSGKYEVPLAIQDRTFNTDGSLFFDSVGINPDIHPYWVPEFFGDTIMVNGKVWPNFDVERHQYRFRLLNGSNARFYELSFDNGMSFTQIGSDGGYLPTPVTLNTLLIAPGERADILVDFSILAPGTKLVLKNTANAPFPGGEPADPQTVGQIMQFTVVPSNRVTPAKLSDTLNTIPSLTPDKSRALALIEVMGPNGPTEVLLNGQRWMDAITELPRVGSAEDWQLVNLTADTHPIHLHLVQYQVVSRQAFNVDQYSADWMALNGMPPVKDPRELPVGPYLQGQPEPPALNEMGWKDTVKANPGEVTTIRVRYAPQDAGLTQAVPGKNLYPFDPTIGPGYAWHCHILDHEDNEMMRPYKVIE